MDKEGLITEHRKLVKILNTGTKTERKKEAKNQDEELKEMQDKPTIRDKFKKGS